MADDLPEQDSDIRRRAAWLLGMLALVAALLVTLMVTFFNSSGGDPDPDNLAGPSDVPSSNPASGSASGSASRSNSARPSTGSSSTPVGPTTSPSSGTPSSGAPSTGASSTGSGGSSGRGTCPGPATCALDTDIADAIGAINAYRTQSGKKAVPGSVSEAAKKCALSNGTDCSGGWAETPVPAENGAVDGAAAVDKIKQFGKLLSDMKSIEVGWAYDPRSKQYYFAVVRQP